jgi:MOSC domain-containing protein YiiM
MIENLLYFLEADSALRVPPKVLARGAHKAVYCYPLAHYGCWKKELPGRELPMGMFGDNFTIDDGGEGLLEESVHLGDRFSVGTAEVAVTQPRLPCYKLGVRFGPTTW